LGGCVADTEVTAPAVLLTQSAVVGIPGRVLTPDDRKAALVDEVPGFAGVFREGDRLVVMIKGEPPQTEAVRAGLTSYLSRGEASAVAMARDRTETISIRPALYDARELQTWREAVRSEVFSSGLAQTLRIDDRQNRIVVTTNDPRLVAQLREVISQLGVPEAAFGIGIMTGTLNNSVAMRRTSSLRSAVSPRVGGLQISRASSPGEECSLAYGASRTGTSNKYMITASHCTWTIASNDGDTLGQPYKGSANVAYEVSDPAYFTGGECPAGDKCLYADAALLQYLGSISAGVGAGASPQTQGSYTYSQNAPVYLTTPVEGDWLRMVGRTSGLQWGELIEDDADVDDQVAGDGYTWLGLMYGDYASDYGDSGAPVYAWFAPLKFHVVLAAGIHKGELPGDTAVFSSIYTAIDEFESDLGGGSFCVQVEDPCTPPPFISVTISGPTQIPSSGAEACAWNAQVSNSTGSVSYEWAWDYSVVGTDSYYVPNGPSEGGHWLSVTVDDDLASDTDGVYVEVDDQYSCN